MADRTDRTVEVADRSESAGGRSTADQAGVTERQAVSGEPEPAATAGAAGEAEPPSGAAGEAGAVAPDRHWRLAHLPVVLATSLGLLVLAACVGGLVAGGAGAAGAAAGVGLVTISYLSSTLVIAGADSIHSSLVLPFGVAMYVAKFCVIGAVMGGVADSGWAGLAPFGWGIVVGIIAWTGANIWWVSTVHLARVRRAARG